MPASVHECAASATIDAEPVRAATTDFATAISSVGAEGDDHGEQALPARGGPVPSPVGAGLASSRVRMVLLRSACASSLYPRGVL